MLDLLWFVAMVVVAATLLVLGLRMEPHWCSPDGSSFTCRVQHVDHRTGSSSRWADARAEITDDGVVIRRKVLLRLSESDDPRAVLRRADSSPRGKAVFLMGGEPMTALRVPAGSRAVPRLDALALH